MQITGTRLLLTGIGAAAIVAGGTPAVAAPPPTDITLVNVATDGTPGDGAVGDAALSANARYVAFASGSTNLVPGDTNQATDIFVRDIVAGTTTLVSGGVGGEPANGFAGYYASISANGRYVAFTSSATNLVPDDRNGWRDIFVHDMRTGTTTRASVFAGGEEIAGPSDGATISADGRYVAFTAFATNIPGPDGTRFTGQEAFVHDMVSGATTRASVPVADSPAQSTFQAAISADGRFVAFSATGGMTGDGGGSGVFVRDLGAGTTVRASVPWTGDTFPDATNPSISADGTRVAFESYDPYVAADTNGTSDVYVRDLAAGTTTLVSAARSGGSANGWSTTGRISGNGRFVAFYSQATDIVRADANGHEDVFLRDLAAGRTRLVSANTAGAPASGDSFTGSPSANGSRVAFLSRATDLGPAVPSDLPNLYLRCLRRC